MPDLEKLLEELDQSSGPESVHVQSVQNVQSKESKERKGDAFLLCAFLCVLFLALSLPPPPVAF